MTEENETKTATVSEDKFNGTSTLEVRGVECADEAEAFARRFFHDEYGHRPSKIVAKEKTHTVYYENVWEVIVAQHSSGSLKDTREYEL